MNRRLKSILAPSLLAALTVGLTGCVVRVAPPPPPVATVTIQPDPPADVVEVQPAMPGPGYLWVGGYYGWEGGRYFWHRGYWGRPPYGYHHWVRDRWTRGPHGYVRVYGHWG